MKNKSIATISAPEFINLQPLEINPLMSSCEIKVLYVGENRNGTFISKEVATEMAKTLRGAPIVGYFKEEKEDFRDHGERMIFDDEGIKFECMTVPYGFVAPTAPVWFKEFEDTDEFGNNLTREYLMTTGYLWTEQYEEAKRVVEEGRPQSMEIDGETMEGHWSTNQKTGMDFFIITDAVFSKLCILGDDVEPCFEGSSITAQEVSKTFTTVDEGFKNTLYKMMQDLKFALEGGQDMTVIQDQETVVESTETAIVEETVVAEATVETEEIVTEEESIETAEVVEEVPTDEQESPEATTEFTSKEEEDKEEDAEDNKDEDQEDNDSADEDSEEDEKKKEDQYTLVSEELSTLKVAYADLETKYQALVEFKENIDRKEKDTLINSFYMLSDEDKKDVVENKDSYSLEEIEAKLSVICVRNKVNFDLEDSSKNEEEVEEVTTYSIDNNGASIPAWISALKKTRDNK